MKMRADTKHTKPPAVKSIALAIAANTLLMAGHSHAGPTGGVVVDGDGSVTQSGTNTRVDQTTDRLSLQWDTFNVASDERVQFVQPSNSSMALNRILDNNGSDILGQIDANGHVILMNPNGIFFGESATVNVGGLVASGLNINSDDFMNGDLIFSGVQGTAGTVVHRGIINAATGGNVALIGKSVANSQGLISANLGHIALAAGSEAVVTFDDQGLIGVRIDKETLASEVRANGAVNNEGSLEAKGGKVLLNASVSADLFSAAVNRGEMTDTTSAVVHDDGSFTLGAGRSVVNDGTIDVSTDADDAGRVVLAGDTVNHRGVIYANAEGSGRAGQVYAEASSQVDLGASSGIEARSAELASGKVSIHTGDLISAPGARVTTTGDTVVSGELMTEVPQIDTHHLYVQGVETITQNGVITASGNMHLNALSSISASLTDANNDFNTFSFGSSYNAHARIVDKNDIALGNLPMTDSFIFVDAVGDGATISQSAGSRIRVDSSELHLAADNVVLGADSTIDMYMGSIDVKFAQHVDTNNAITLGEGPSGIHPNNVRIEGAGDLSGGVTLTGNKAMTVDLKATIDESAETLIIDRMTGDNASLDGLYQITQTGPIALTDALTWNSYMATLEHSENDVAALQGAGAIAFGHLHYVDKNDVMIRNMDVTDENIVSITSVGEGSAIRQLTDTRLSSDFIELSADNIYLGASGTSEVSAGYDMKIDFGRHLYIDGAFNAGAGWYAPSLTITGNEKDNRLVYGRNASTTSFAGDDLLASLTMDLGDGNDTVVFNSEFVVGDDADWSANSLDMGAGNDRVYFNKSVNIPLTLGAGSNYLRIWNYRTFFDAVDFSFTEDRFRAYRPGWR